MYGSNNGFIFIELTEASQLTRLSENDYINNNRQYTKNVNLITEYLYYGIVVNKLAGNNNLLNFMEMQLFGYESENKGGSGGIGYTNTYNDYLGGELYKPTDIINYTSSTASLWTILNSGFSIVSLNSSSVSGNSSGNGGIGSRDAITTDANARHGQNGGWGFAIVLFDYN